MNDLPAQLSESAGDKKLSAGQPGLLPPKRGAEESIWGCSQPLSRMFERRGARENVRARTSKSSTKSSALGPSTGTAGEIRRVRGEFKLTLALLVGVWLFIAAFVLLALWLKWRL
jgi:hypothetical protein